MRVIGLTGGIASGKSTVSEILAGLGAVIIDADVLSREVTMPGSQGLRRIREAFGDKVIATDGTLDRRKLGTIIFRDEASRQYLNSIIHPLVIQRTEQELRRLQEEARKSGKSIVAVVDAPLLIEAGVDVICDEVWVVAVSRETQAERLMKREGYTLGEALSRIDAQMPLSEKEKRATHIINNEGTRDQTRERVLHLWERL
ncbi:MAG: dephospho-CoA kinase [Bacillota bacterium]